MVTPARRKTAPANSARVFDIIDRVHEQASRVGCVRNAAIDGPRRRGDHETRAVQIRFDERPLTDVHDLGADRRAHLRSHDGDLCASVEQAGQLLRRHRPAADQQDATALKSEKDGKNGQFPSANTVRSYGPADAGRYVWSG